MLSTMSNTIIPVLLWNISEKKWFTVGFSCTKWHYLILVTLSADNHRLLDFLFRFPKIFLSKWWCVQKKNWKWITALDRVATMIQIMHEFLFFFPKLSPLLPLVVWYYKKKNSTTLQAMILGKITWKYICAGIVARRLGSLRARLRWIWKWYSVDYTHRSNFIWWQAVLLLEF